jgi:hypothetical protein
MLALRTTPQTVKKPSILSTYQEGTLTVACQVYGTTSLPQVGDRLGSP